MANDALLVEGKTDAIVFANLCEHHRIPERFRIKEKSGIETLLEELDVELDASGLEHLGIVIDADTDIDARWASLTARLANLGYTLPKTPLPAGTIVFQPERPTVGIWMMPDNTLPGRLEDFVSFLGATDDALWRIAENCVQEVAAVERRFIQNHFIKAHIHTWLAWQESPGTPLGQAITKRYLDADAPYARQFIEWIKQLFKL